jgi:hypothetical protein
MEKHVTDCYNHNTCRSTCSCSRSSNKWSVFGMSVGKKRRTVLIRAITLQVVSCLVGTGALTLEIKRPGCEFEGSPRLVPEVKD